MTATTLGHDSHPALAEFRAETLRGCLEGGQEAGAPAASAEQFCTCAVDRAVAGRSAAELEAETRANSFEARFQTELDACIGETGN